MIVVDIKLQRRRWYAFKNCWTARSLSLADVFSCAIARRRGIPILCRKCRPKTNKRPTTELGAYEQENEISYGRRNMSRGVAAPSVRYTAVVLFPQSSCACLQSSSI
jgi:hypothetical protein